MKRDMELIRLLLFQVEGETPNLDLSNYSEEQRVYHSALLIEAGLVDGEIIQNGSGYPAATVVIRLKWAGHDFLDAVREDTIWKKIQNHVIKPGMSWTFSLVAEYAKHEIKRRLFGDGGGGADADAVG